MRTKHCKLIARETCRSATPIRLKLWGHPEITMTSDNIALSLRHSTALDRFAQYDGFTDFDAMTLYFAKLHKTFDFTGVLIAWLDFPLPPNPAVDFAGSKPPRPRRKA